MQESKHEGRSPEHERRPAQFPWHFPVLVDDVVETGLHFDLAADAQMRAAVARLAGLRDLPRLEAHFDVGRHGVGGVRVTGVVTATVGQTCVVTLEPLANEVEEAINLIFEPGAAALGHGDPVAPLEQSVKNFTDAREPLTGDRIDLGALATEFLVLGLDPYPRKPGAVFDAPPQVEPEPEPGPFAALAGLKRDGNGR